jgi:Ca2+-binding EF-hand superfamily protein
MGVSQISLNTRSKIVQKKLAIIENELMKKLQMNFNNVRKAFLELDTDNDGWIEGEDMAKYLKNITLGDDTKLDYSQLELLIKMRCNQTSTRINYNSFCQWLG